MKITKKAAITASAAFAALLSIQAALAPAPPPPPPGYPPISGYQQEPPLATDYWIQWLATPLEDGSNMRVLIKYEELEPLQPSLNIYWGSGSADFVTFNDQGTGADDTPGDSVYSAYIQENVSQFMAQVNTMQSNMNATSPLLQFSGHVGVERSAPQPFNTALFNQHQLVYLDPYYLNGWFCCTSCIKKEKSLFITDTTVTQDPARTYNPVTNTGTAMGLWTFGNMMKNIGGTSAANQKAVLLSFVENWMKQDTVNGQVVVPRTDALLYMIRPWLQKAKGTTTDYGNISGSADYWKTAWNSTATDTLLKYAPFRLMAIVNRLDLRQNTAYSNVNIFPLATGETRFIFTLIIDKTISIYNVAGDVPVSEDQDFQNPFFADWRGMNVIFEYGNIQTSACAIQAFGQDWVTLSSLNFGTTAFNDKLDQITRPLINVNGAPSKINGSAINRLRTNERIFFRTNHSRESWKASNWQFRQLELNSTTHALKLAPVSLTPRLDANLPWAINNWDGCTNCTDADSLLYWFFGTGNPRIALSARRGRVSIPATYRAGVAEVDRDFNHYWDLNWENTTYTDVVNTGANAPEKGVRRAISLNTCQGCHTGETKTIFTHVLPQGYGKTAKYWTTTPDTFVGPVDMRFGSNNLGFTNVGGSNMQNYPQLFNNHNIAVVSAFLTGRKYDSLSYDDDKPTDSNDNNMNGLFYVNDPSNDAAGAMQFLNIDTNQNGYNDLEMRRQSLCRLIGTSCTKNVMRLLSNVDHKPAPPGTH